MLIIFTYIEHVLLFSAKLVKSMSEQTIQSNSLFRENKLIPRNAKNEISCSICENCNFKVERIAPEIIRLICENCGERYRITPNIFAHKMLYLEFCISDMNE